MGTNTHISIVRLCGFHTCRMLIAFIIIIVLLSILAGGVFFYYVLWPMIRTRLDGVPVASESELKIPEGGGGGKDN